MKEGRKRKRKKEKRREKEVRKGSDEGREWTRGKVKED